MIDNFVHNIDLIALSRKSFRPQNSEDETVLADETDYVWNPDCSHPLYIIIPTETSSQTITTFSINKGYVRIIPLTIDATPLSYSALFTDRTGNNCLNSTFINTQGNLNETRNFTQQDNQFQSHLVNEEIVETMLTKTPQNIFPHSFILHLQLQERKTQHFRIQPYNPR